MNLLRELAQGSRLPAPLVLTRPSTVALASDLDLGSGFQGDFFSADIGSGFQDDFSTAFDPGVSLLLDLGLAALLPVRPASLSYSLAFVSRF